MKIDLKYGCNPHQKPAHLLLPDPAPLTLVNGVPSYINILDALGAWQLARELKTATGSAAAASFKHTSPAGAAIARPLNDAFLASQFLTDRDLSPAALAYIRARGGDRMSSFGDVAAVSDIVDESLALVLKREVCDLIIAPGFTPVALRMLKEKKKGAFLILQIDGDYQPPKMESRDLFGFSLQQFRNETPITAELFANPVTTRQNVPTDVLETLIVATIALKYTQSNSVSVAYDGQLIGVGAGQQSRVHCTRLACDKADKWFLQQHAKTRGLTFKPELKRPDKANIVDQYLLWNQLSEPERAQMLSGLSQKPEPITPEEKTEWIGSFVGVCLSSDAFIPFRDNIDRANRSHVQVIAQAGGSLRDQDVTDAADEYGMVMFHTGLRLFLH
ncbi:phosphoribosylaminoimidazolecarboxamide formyltransferase [candidate division KSB1 bacterium]|nr:phosphoribosylaminoimidazolecarboxamide formyltransferase [candidate division KSB1 bacterium]